MVLGPPLSAKPGGPPSDPSSECNVKVVVRVRPLVARERLAGAVESLHLVPGAEQIVAGSEHSYAFDQVFGSDTGQGEIFDGVVSPALDAFVQGFNCTILAYGQTGSGKTFTMGTGLDGALDESTAGIIPRAVSRIWSLLPSDGDEATAEMYVSFLEIYNEEIVDLLNPSTQHDSKTKKGILAIREDSKGDIFVTGIKEERMGGPGEVLACLQNGSLCRTTKSTQMNLVSSRSHAIFTITLRQRRRVEDSMEWRSLISKLHFVDLAGSERLKRTQAAGDRAKESISINSGLLALGNVISALGDESKRSLHVPYRDSKLTRLLQDSLGGNSRTLMIACVSPSSDNLAETLNTLKYAHRARNIKNKVEVREDAAGDAAFEVVQLKKQVAALKQQLNQLRSSRPEKAISNTPVDRSVADLQRRLDAVLKEKRLVEQERDQLKAALTSDPTRSPKTKEYLRTISELRSRLVELESKNTNISATKKSALSAPQRKTNPNMKIPPASPSQSQPVEPGTPKWFHAVDDLLDRAKTEIEQAYDAMDKVYEAPAAFLPQPDDEENTFTAISSDQLAAVVATRTEAILSQVRTDLGLRAELVQQIEACKQEYLFMRARFEERIALLQANLKSVQAERDLALNNTSTNNSAEARAGLNRLTRQKYEERIKKLGKEINDLKDRLRTSIHSTTSKTSATDTLVRNLRSTISNLKIENGRLTAQVNDQLGKLKTDCADREQELREAKQAERRAQEAARKWKKAHEFQKGLLQKRIEQCLHARSKIRQLVGLLRRNRVNLGSPSSGIDWGSPGWKALQAEHPSPLIPSRLMQRQDEQDEPIRKFPISQLSQKSVSATDLADEAATEDLAEAASQLMIDSDPASPFLDTPRRSRPASVLSQCTSPVLSPIRPTLPVSALKASPLLPRRRDFFCRLADISAIGTDSSGPSPGNHKRPTQQ